MDEFSQAWAAVEVKQARAFLKKARQKTFAPLGHWRRRRQRPDPSALSGHAGEGRSGPSRHHSQPQRGNSAAFADGEGI
jgi:hypothetical protein